MSLRHHISTVPILTVTPSSLSLFPYIGMLRSFIAISICVNTSTFCDPKSSYQDIIQSLGRGTRPDGLGPNGENELNHLDVLLPL